VYVFVSFAPAASDWGVCFAVLRATDYNYYENAAAFVFPLERTWLSMEEQLFSAHLSLSLCVPSNYHHITIIFW
jgi:hypothetical protein